MLGGILLLGYQGYYLNTTGKPVESIVNPNIQPNSNIPNHKMGGFLKWGIPKIPWVSILSHGRFGATPMT